MIQFWIAFSSLFLFPLFLPKLQLLFFAPYLISTLYKREMMPTLWRCVWCGLLVDLFATTPLFGLTALTYVLTLLILRTQKRNFFEDKLGTLPLMTALFSMLATLFTALFFFIFAQQMLFSVTDLFGMALFDALYALLFFALPFQITKKIVRLMR